MTSDSRKQTSFASGNGQVDSVEEYKFEPIKGYPMLQWRGKRPFTSTQYYPAQHKETYGPEVNGWRNKLYWGDNLQVMSHLLRDYRGQIKLIYIDPPFDSKADYKKRINLGGARVAGDHNMFEEKQYADAWTNDEYLQFMYERIVLLRELLSDNGAIFLHCDWHQIHHLRSIMDEILGNGGEDLTGPGFKNEIIWKRTNAHSNAKQGAQYFGRIHDTILFYTKSSSFTWKQQYTPYSDDYIKQNYRMTDSNGRRFQPVDLTASKPGGDTSYEWKGYKLSSGKYWAYSKENMEKFDREGKLYYTSSGLPRMKYYLDEMPGVPLQDLWTDISLSSQSSERLDYPTQKPEPLLERIINTCSDRGDIVFDCFMGSGTTQAVAMKLGRRFIGADINLGAVQTTTKRLLATSAELQQPQRKLDLNGDSDAPTIFYTGFEVYNVNNYDIFRNPVEAKDLLLQALEVNRLQPGSLFDGEKDGRMVKIMPVNRIATRQDLNELITGFDYRAFERRQAANPNQPVEKITLVCMGHEPGLGAHLQREVTYKLDVEVVDILRDKQDLQFKRESEAKITVKGGKLVIERFYPMNLLSKLSLQQEKVGDWRELVESVMIDWNYDGAVLQPALIDIPEGDGLVAGSYSIPKDAGTIRVKITDLLSESLEQEVRHG